MPIGNWMLRISTQDYIQNTAVQFRQKGIAAKAEYREATIEEAAGEIMKVADKIQTDIVAMSTLDVPGLKARGMGFELREHRRENGACR